MFSPQQSIPVSFIITAVCENLGNSQIFCERVLRCAKKGNQSAAGGYLCYRALSFDPCLTILPGNGPDNFSIGQEAEKDLYESYYSHPRTPSSPNWTPVFDCVDKQLALPLSRSVVSLQPHANSAEAHKESHQDSMTDKSTLLPILIKNKAICMSLISRSRSILSNLFAWVSGVL